MARPKKPRKQAQWGTRACVYCAKSLRASTCTRHERICLANPQVALRLRAFLREHPVRGRMMGARDYTDSRPEELPAVSTLLAYFGHWYALTAWAGMHACAMLDSDAPGDPYDWSQTPDDDPCQELPLYGSVSLRPVYGWHVHQQQYVVVGYERRIMLR